MARNSTIQIRVDDELKKDADELFTDLGLDTPTAIRMFLTQAVKRRGIPFDISQPAPNAETIAAMKDVDNRRNLYGPFDNVKDLMSSLSESDDV